MKFKMERAALVLAFLLPAAIMLTLFMINGIYPFGDRSFLFSDMYHQYMPFFSELLHKVRGGESLSFSYQVGIGSNFLALYGYYLASPFHVLALLVPEAFLMEFMSYLVVVKIGLCGLASCIYLRRHFGTRDGAVLFFACFYALSGFMAAYNYNIMWLDCVVLLPLIVLGLERLVKEGRCGLYCVTLGLSIFTNFYISIMICIFLVLYFGVLLALEKKRLRSLGYFTLYSLLAGGMAAVLLIPEVCAILQSDFGDMDFPKMVEYYFSVMDMLARHCMCVYTERGLDHWPNIYCGSAALMLIPMYVANQKISIREKFCRLALAGFMLLSFSTNILDFIWHGLNYPDSLPARQSFIYILLVLVMCYDAYRHVKDAPPRMILYGYLAAVVFILFCEKFIDHEDFELGVKLLTLVFVTIYGILLYLYRTRREASARIGLAAAALAAVIAEPSLELFRGLWRIVTSEAGLITDPIVTGGLGAALLNTGLVLLWGIAIARFQKLPFTGATIACLMMLAGFAFLGKNILNIQPILLGTWLYCRFTHETFAKYVYLGMYATCLSPMVSHAWASLCPPSPPIPPAFTRATIFTM